MKWVKLTRVWILTHILILFEEDILNVIKREG